MTDGETPPGPYDALFEWLGPTRAEGEKKYGTIQNRLIRILVKRGCNDPENCVGEAIDRLALKLPEPDTYVGEKLWYFIRFALNVHKEHLRWPEVPFETVPETVIQPEVDLAKECLQECLELLAGDQRDLVLDYHLNIKKAKIDLHRSMAEELGLTTNALRLRVHRLRMGLEKCVLTCLNGAAK
jgi:DNA-directed RNA polymerase specialized sigma24 family protein